MQKLTNALKQKQQGQNQNNGKDNRFWRPTVDKAGNAFAIIRFLPEPKGEEMPFVQYFDHSFQGPAKKWYIEKSLSTFGLNDPVSELNRELWASGIDAKIEIAKKQKRRENYVANVLVVRDPENTEAEGKVFLYRFGKKIYQKIVNQIQPEFEGEEPCNVFDPWQGKNFKLKGKTLNGFFNYDNSEWASVSKIADTDDQINTIWSSQHSLKDFSDPSNFKTYEELKKRLDIVLGKNQDISIATPASTSSSANEQDEEFTRVMDNTDLDDDFLNDISRQIDSMDLDSIGNR